VNRFAGPSCSAVSALLEALELAFGRVRFRLRAESARVQELWPDGQGRGEVARLRWALRLWHRLYSRSNDACLERSLQLAAILRRQEREAEIFIGFRRTADGRFVGHAWVEGAGVTRDDAGHVPVLRLTAAPGRYGAELLES
jgi:hypothetical protein